MKKSLLRRGLLILVILAGWAYSLYPLKDRDFIQTFRHEAKGKVDAKLEKLFEQAGKDVAASRDKARQAEERRAAGEDVARVAVTPIETAVFLAAAAGQNDVYLGNYVEIYGNPKPNNKDVVYYIRELARAKLQFGMDLRGGTEFRIAFNKANLSKEQSAPEVRDTIIEILRKRIDPRGMTEVEIRPNSPTSIAIKTPSVDPVAVNEIREMLKRPARLEFRIVHEKNDDLLSSGKEYVPDHIKMPHESTDDKGNKVRSFLWVKRTPEKVRGKHLVSAGAEQTGTGQFEVSMVFNAAGATFMSQTTSANIGKRMAIILDGTIFSAPVIQSEFSSRGRITGNFTYKEANQLAIVLKSGNLPVDISIEGEMGTDPTLGKGLIRSGMLACGIGMAMVVLFMIAYYRLAGVIAVCALTTNVLLIFGTLPILKATLSLPGIAGIVLTIGMAVDANVLIFERIREELNTGKSLITAIKNGYSRAFITILDANLTTLFTAYFLYVFGSGTIKGFAVTLGVGIVASMFTALFMTRWLFDLLIEYNLLKNPALMHSRLRKREAADRPVGEEPAPPGFPFVDFRRISGVCSLVLIIAAIAAFAGRGKSALSVDFTGGTMVNMQYNKAAGTSAETIRQALGKIKVSFATLNFEKEIPREKIHQALAAAQYKNCLIAYRLAKDAEKRVLEIVFRKELPAKRKASEYAAGLLNRKFPEAKFTSLADQVVDGYKNSRATYKFSVVGETQLLEVVLSEKLPSDRDAAEYVAWLLSKDFPEAKFTGGSTSVVGGLVGRQFTTKAIYSIVSALLVIILYISFRFEFSYALGAVVALAHDVIICTGIYLVANFGDRQLSLTVIAALLTIIGYSLNDTIVVFDRIRENLDLLKKKDFLAIVNLSLNQTLSRTVLTSLTTIFVVLCLYVVGGGAINDFALVMLAGVIVGTYSSIFVATPVMIFWHQRRLRSASKRVPAAAKPRAAGQVS